MMLSVVLEPFRPAILNIVDSSLVIMSLHVRKLQWRERLVHTHDFSLDMKKRHGSELCEKAVWQEQRQQCEENWQQTCLMFLVKKCGKPNPKSKAQIRMNTFTYTCSMDVQSTGLFIRTYRSGLCQVGTITIDRNVRPTVGCDVILTPKIKLLSFSVQR